MFSKGPKYNACSFFVTADKLAALLLELNDAYDVGMDVASIAHGVPMHIMYNNKLGLFKVYLPSHYVKALAEMMPIYTIEERYGVDHNTFRPSSRENTTESRDSLPDDGPR